MAWTAAVVVEIDSAVGRFSAERNHCFGVVDQAFAIVADGFSRAEADTESAAVRLDAERQLAALGNSCQSGKELFAQGLDLRPEGRLLDLLHEPQPRQHGQQWCVE